MKKSLTFIIVLVLLITFAFSAFSCKKEPVDYYPLGVGSYWEYSVLAYMENGMTQMSKELVKVIGKERVGDLENYVIDRYTLEGTVPSVGQYREFLVKTEKGVECTKRAFPLLFQLKAIYPGIQTEIRHSPPEERFRYNLQDLESWRWEGIVALTAVSQQPEEEAEGQQRPAKPPEIKQVEGFMEYKYLGHETIKVMNQEMDCMKFSVFGKSDSGEEIESYVWYAPNIGRAREEQKFFKGSKSVLYLFELEDYSITNKEPFKWK